VFFLGVFGKIKIDLLLFISVILKYAGLPLAISQRSQVCATSVGDAKQISLINCRENIKHLFLMIQRMFFR